MQYTISDVAQYFMVQCTKKKASLTVFKSISQKIQELSFKYLAYRMQLAISDVDLYFMIQ